MSSSLSAMSKRLEGKTVLVTGASSGIGKSVAQEFARTSPNNLKIIITARRIDTLKKVAAEITQEVGQGVKVLPVQLDISKPEEIASFVPNLPDEFKDIDILVNNAGLVKGVDKAPDIKAQDIDVMFATNVTGLIHMTQAVLPIFKKKNGGANGGRGDVIMIGSIAGREGYPGGSIYCATKAAVRTFTDALRRELIATRIRVIEVDPGQVETVSTTYYTTALLSFCVLFPRRLQVENHPSQFSRVVRCLRQSAPCAEHNDPFWQSRPGFRADDPTAPVCLTRPVYRTSTSPSSPGYLTYLSIPIPADCSTEKKRGRGTACESKATHFC